MKRIFALLLAVLMVTSVMVFTTAAEETTTTLPTTEFVPIVTEDNMPTQDADNATLEAETRNGVKWNPNGIADKTLAYDNGAKAVYFNVADGTTAAGGFACNTPWTDFSKMTTLHFDLYISDVEVAKASVAQWKIQMNMSAGGSRNYWGTLADMCDTALVNGWNHMEVPIREFNGSTSSKLSRILIYKNDTTALGDVKFMLKNVYFANDEIPVIMTTDMKNLTDSEKANMNTWHGSVYPQWRGQSKFDGKLTYDDATGGVGYTGTGSFGNGAGYLIKTAKLDVSGMTKLCFDLYVSDIETAGADTVIWRVQIKNTTKGHTRTIQQPLTYLAELSGNTLVNGWNHFEVPFSALDNSAANLTQVNEVYIRVWDSTNGGKFGAADKELTIMLKDIYYAQDVTWNTDTSVIMASDMTNLTDSEKANMNTWHSSVYPQWRGQSKFDGKLTYDDATGGVGYTGTGSFGNGAGYLIKTAKQDVTTMAKFCFDLYVSDIETANADTVIWRVQIKNTTKGHTRTIQQPLTYLAELSGNTLVNGWNHFEIPFSALDNSAADLTQVNEVYIRVWDSTNGGTFGAADKEMTIMLRDIYFAKSAGVAKVASAQPALTNSFNLTYKVSADDQIVYKPVVDVTFDGETTRQALNADGTFPFNNILAHRLSENIMTTVTAMDKNGDILKTTHTYSIKDYCRNMLALESVTNHSADQLAALKRLVSDMLYYGGAAQTSVDYNMENVASNVDGILTKTTVDTTVLANYKIDTPVTDTRSQEEKAAAVATWKSASLVLDSALVIRFGFDLVAGADVPTVKVNEIEYTPVLNEETGRYYVDVPTFANRFGDEFVATFGDDTTYSATYSVNAYVARNYSKYEQGSAMSDLLGAIYNYGASAEAYVEAMNQ